MSYGLEDEINIYEWRHVLVFLYKFYMYHCLLYIGIVKYTHTITYCEEKDVQIVT